MASNHKLIKDAGGVSAVAREFGISAQAVYKWLEGEVPPERVLALVQLAGKEWTPEKVRPDVKWVRDTAGVVTHYMTPVSAANSPQSKAAA